MASLTLTSDRKEIEIIDNNKFITFTQFDDSKLNSKFTEINIEKEDIKEVINVLKKIISE